MIKIRPIKKKDNRQIAMIIREILEEYNSAIPGTAYFDKSLDDMTAAYRQDDTIYFVAEWNGEVIGGAGIGKLPGEPDEYCELQKMYILSQARGKGVGRRLMEACLDFARKSGYKKCYLETFSYMRNARKLYEKNGFNYIKTPRGNTSHTACDVWMEMDLGE